VNCLNWIALYTLSRREIVRFFRIWTQTLLPSPISIVLYFAIFGGLIGPRIGLIEGYRYVEYIAPGLIMMAIINNSFANVVASFFGNKFHKNIEEMLVSPMGSGVILLGFLLGGVARGCLVGLLVMGVALFFTHLSVHHIGLMGLVILCTALLFSLLGFINAVFSRKFDDINTLPTFVLTPLTHFGGVFYSAEMLPSFAQKLSYCNPVFYIVNAFRYSMLGVSDVSVDKALIFIILFNIIFYGIAWWLIDRGIAIKS